MISVKKIGKTMNDNVLELVGLAKDVKPIKDMNGREIVNGSTFIEMDTKNVFIYDAENNTWLPL